MVTEYDTHQVSNCGLGFQNSWFTKELHFSYNFISEFEFLIMLNELETIILSYNNIETINQNAFDSLRALKKIDLSYNSLNHMKDFMTVLPALFRANHKLLSVDLSSNGLSLLPNETFLVNSELREIHLFGNVFTQLSLDFSFLSNLTTLDLRFNKIQFLDSESRQKLDTFYKRQSWATKNETLNVLLAGNPFRCDCKALDFLQWFVTSPIFNSSYIWTASSEFVSSSIPS